MNFFFAFQRTDFIKRTESKKTGGFKLIWMLRLYIKHFGFLSLSCSWLGGWLLPLVVLLALLVVATTSLLLAGGSSSSGVAVSLLFVLLLSGSSVGSVLSGWLELSTSAARTTLAGMDFAFGTGK